MPCWRDLEGYKCPVRKLPMKTVQRNGMQRLERNRKCVCVFVEAENNVCQVPDMNPTVEYHITTEDVRKWKLRALHGMAY